MNDWFEIFRTGEHTDSSGRKRNWSEGDLDKIAGSYDPAVNEAPIVIGHPADNSPAYGWIEKLKRAGDRLLALPRNVVPEFAEAVKQGLYKKRSVSLYPDGTLRHVGFLGGAIPAVKGLQDIAFEENPAVSEYEFGGSAEDDPAHPAANINDEAEKLRLDFSESEERRKRAEEKLRELETKLRLTEFSAYLSQKTASGILTPAQNSKLRQISESFCCSEFSSTESKAMNLLKEFIETLEPRFTLDEIAVKKGARRDDEYRSPAQIIADEIVRGQAVLRNIQ